MLVGRINCTSMLPSIKTGKQLIDHLELPNGEKYLFVGKSLFDMYYYYEKRKFPIVVVPSLD
jgi:hypothetical protein